MTFPNINPLIETFLEPTRIHLFGKPFPTLQYDPAPMTGGGGAAQREFGAFTAPAQAGADIPMPPGPVERTLREVGNAGLFARIYGFSFEGHYYKVPRPLLFLLGGDDRSRPPEEAAVNGLREFNTRFTGVEGKDWDFGSDIRVWAVDRHDIAVCLDLEIDTYDQVLLQSLTGDREETGFRGRASSRNAADFRGRGMGPHQDR